MEGNKVLEVKQSRSTKGQAAASWLAQERGEFLLAVVADRTEEEMLAALPADAYSLKVADAPPRPVSSWTWSAWSGSCYLLLCRQISG